MNNNETIKFASMNDREVFCKWRDHWQAQVSETAHRAEVLYRRCVAWNVFCRYTSNRNVLVDSSVLMTPERHSLIETLAIKLKAVGGRLILEGRNRHELERTAKSRVSIKEKQFLAREAGKLVDRLVHEHNVALIHPQQKLERNEELDDALLDWTTRLLKDGYAVTVLLHDGKLSGLLRSLTPEPELDYRLLLPDQDELTNLQKALEILVVPVPDEWTEQYS